LITTTPNILYVTSFFPHGPSSGAQLRVLNIGRQLSRIGKLSLVVVCSDEIDYGSLDRTRDEFEVKHIAKVIPDPLRTYWGRAQYELDPTFLNTRFTAVTEADRHVMLNLIRAFDVIWVHSIRTANEFRIYQWPHSVLDIDDIQSRLLFSYAQNDSNFIRRLLDYRLALIWRRRECLLRNRFNALCVCSKQDRQYLGENNRTHVIPNGFDPPFQVPARTPAVPARLGFIGSFGFMPNRSGVEWFIKKIWPRVKRDAPDTRLRLIGEDSEKELPQMGPDIDGLGFVKDASGEIATWSAMIVPIRVGAGTRGKIAEAFSRKCPVISTSLGAYGYEVVDGEELVLADDDEKFGQACVRLIIDSALGERISETAWQRFLREFTWDSIGQSVESAVRSCLELPGICHE
jgi:polysaccharide biosynthesis protein PslH